MEFPVVVDRASYVIPTVGIAMIGATLGAIVAMGAGIALGASFPETAAASLTTVAAMSWIVLAGVGSAAWFVRRRWRIHHERKLIIDGEGITFVPFSNQGRLFRWRDIASVEEKEEWGPDEGLSLVYALQNGRSFTVEDRDYQGYDEIRRLTVAYLPSRVTLFRKR